MVAKKKKKKKDFLFGANISALFMAGATRMFIVMFISMITMWLVAIFTKLIDINIIVAVSAGIGVSFGAMHIYNITLENL